MAVEVILYGSDGKKDVSVQVDYLRDEKEGFRTYGLKVGNTKAVRVNALELEDAIEFCKNHQD